MTQWTSVFVVHCDEPALSHDIEGKLVARSYLNITKKAKLKSFIIFTVQYILTLGIFIYIKFPQNSIYFYVILKDQLTILHLWSLFLHVSVIHKSC